MHKRERVPEKVNSASIHSTEKPVITMLTYPWKCIVLHCNHLGNTWKPLVLMTRHFDYCPSASEGDNQSVRSSAPVVSRCFPGGYNVKLYISRGRLAWWLLAFFAQCTWKGEFCEHFTCISPITCCFFSSSAYSETNYTAHFKTLTTCRNHLMTVRLLHHQYGKKIEVDNFSEKHCFAWVANWRGRDGTDWVELQSIKFVRNRHQIVYIYTHTHTHTTSAVYPGSTQIVLNTHIYIYICKLYKLINLCWSTSHYIKF